MMYGSHMDTLFCYYSYGDHRDLHSCPARRSSDLKPSVSETTSTTVVPTAPSAGAIVPAPLRITCTPSLLPSRCPGAPAHDRKSTRLNSSHANISYAVFWLK